MRNVKVISFNPRPVEATTARIKSFEVVTVQFDQLDSRFMSAFGPLLIVANIDGVVESYGCKILDVHKAHAKKLGLIFPAAPVKEMKSVRPVEEAPAEESITNTITEAVATTTVVANLEPAVEEPLEGDKKETTRGWEDAGGSDEVSENEGAMKDKKKGGRKKKGE